MIGIVIKFADSFYNQFFGKDMNYRLLKSIDFATDLLTEIFFLISMNNYYLIFMNSVELVHSGITLIDAIGWIWKWIKTYHQHNINLDKLNPFYKLVS